MTIVDERGRLFGRFNLIDAAVVLVVVVLVPLVYAAYLLFRPPAMKILSVNPARIEQGRQGQFFIVSRQGENDHARKYNRRS